MSSRPWSLALLLVIAVAGCSSGGNETAESKRSEQDSTDTSTEDRPETTDASKVPATIGEPNTRTARENQVYDSIERVDALVAVKAIPRGTTGRSAFEQGLIGYRERTQESIPANIVKDARALNDLVAVSDVSENQFITIDTFGPAGRR